MANFGERLAYWYLRLNGFFTVQDFVLHRLRPHDDDGRYNADADLLAIRLRHSGENIDNVPLAPDERLVAEPYQIRIRNVALVVQVKTGKGGNVPGSAFRRERLEACLRFVGLVGEEQVGRLVSSLEAQSHIDVVPEWRVAKLLISEAPIDSADYFSLGLGDIHKFIEQRLRRFRAAKQASRILFPDELIQFLAWKAGVDG
jgi:hypothetical protein